MSQFASIIRKYLSILSVILIFGCAKEPEFDAPMVQTGSVTQITEQGVTLVGLVTYAGRGDAEVGFVWDVNPNPIVGTASKVSLPNVSKGAIEARVTYGLENLVTYYVRAYGKSGNQMVYGESTSFISLGSQIPTISGFSPLQGGAGTTITITGNNFSNTVSNVQVRLSGIPLVVLSSSGTSIEAQIPPVFNFSGPLPLTVTISNVSVTAAQPFTMAGPRVTGFTPNKGIGGDTLTVSGIGFSTTMSQDAVWIGPTKLTLLTASANKLKAILPLDIVPIEDRVYVYVNLIRCESQANFTVGCHGKCWRLHRLNQILLTVQYNS